MPTDKRNTQVRLILNNLFEKATSEEEINEQEYITQLNQLFTTQAWGFREILLVVIVAMKLNSNYKASTGLYECNPRAIYEGPIKEFLIEKNIPHRKSGPLNVAKATVGLDNTWAAQRRPAVVAEQVVELVNYLETPGCDRETRIDNVGVSLLRCLINETIRIGELTVTIDDNTDPCHIYSLCYQLTTQTPDAGNTPQKIAAFLLKNYHLFPRSGIIVTGAEDRASVTSTTSKKPGDVNEEIAGTILKVYEITVKKFDLARIIDSYDCITDYNHQNATNIHEVIVICRSKDCPEEMEYSGLYGYLGKYAYQDVIYYFWDIFEWYSNTLQRMTDEARLGFYMNLNDYINEINTAEDVKNLWHNLHHE